MNSSIKNIIVTPYNPKWPHYFATEAEQIKAALADNFISIHHVGSTSVPGLMAKSIIDIIGAVKNGVKAIPNLEKLGYAYKGEYNIPMRFYFSKKTAPEIHLHVYEENHPEIALNLLFRDYLRTHPSARNDYAHLKATLLADPSSFEKKNSDFAGYALGKNDFINKIVRTAGFEQLRFVQCLHEAEWAAYHRIRQSTLFMPYNPVYDPDHPTMTADNHFHFVLYKGVDIVSAAQVEWLEKQEAVLRSLATDKVYQGQGFGNHFLHLIECWVKHQNRHTIKLHAALPAESFYRNRGYKEMVFNDQSLLPDVVDLGKYL